MKNPDNIEAYQIEVKHALLEKKFRPQDGWTVTVSLDGMERGTSNLPESVDFIAEKEGEIWLIEVVGFSSRQIEQRFYSALGQLISRLEQPNSKIKLGLAFPDTLRWRDTVKKCLPHWVHEALEINVFHFCSLVRK